MHYPYEDGSRGESIMKRNPSVYIGHYNKFENHQEYYST